MASGPFYFDEQAIRHALEAHWLREFRAAEKTPEGDTPREGVVAVCACGHAFFEAPGEAPEKIVAAWKEHFVRILKGTLA